MKVIKYPFYQYVLSLFIYDNKIFINTNKIKVKINLFLLYII